MRSLGNSHPLLGQCLPTNGFYFRQFQQAAPRQGVGGGRAWGTKCAAVMVFPVCVLVSAGVLTPEEVQSQDPRPVLTVQPRGWAQPCHPLWRSLLGPCQVHWIRPVFTWRKQRHQQDTVKDTDCMAAGE